MENTEKFSNTKEVIAFLSETFPNCFTLEGDAKPLKIGIFQDLSEALKDEARISKTLLRSSLRHYTNSWRYLYAVKEGANRVNLTGETDAAVEKEHEEHAQKQLKESKQKLAERKKAQEPKPKADTEKKSFKNKTKKDSQTKLNGTNVKYKRSNKLPKPEKLSDEHLVAGTSVTVKVGKIPMPATITEITKDGVQVVLESGMQIKVQESNLRLAVNKR